MSSREQYAPGAAFGARIQKEGERWTLVLVRDLRHPPAKVWTALTDPEHLRRARILAQTMIARTGYRSARNSAAT